MSTPDLPSPPFIDVPGILNFRDLLASNSSLRPGLIYRCADPSRVSPDGISILQELGIQKCYDLRSLPEIKKSEAMGRGSPRSWEGCERVFVPVFRDEDYSPEGVAGRYASYASHSIDGFVQAYKDILNAAPDSYRVIFNHLADDHQKPLIVHCTAGKDRTGVLCALILSLCGVPDDEVAREYELTEFGLSKEWKETVVEHLMANPALSGNREGAWRMIGARHESMLATLKAIREEFGGAEAYVIEKCGLSKEDVEKIRSNLQTESKWTAQVNL